MRRLLFIACAACSSPSDKPDAPPPPDAAQPSVEITPGSHDFGSYEVDSGATPPSLLYTVKNVHGSDIDITGVATSGDGASAYTIKNDNTCKGTLADGATCSFTLQFLPLTAEARHATLDVTTSVDVVSADLSGAGSVSGAKLVFSPSVLDFGDVTVGGTSEVKTITILNEAADATLVAAVIDPKGSTFTLVSTDCNAHVPLHGMCTAMVKMSPPYAGDHQATLAITSDSTPSGSAGLRGTSQTPFVSMPYAATLGSMLIGQAEAGNTRAFTVTNNGTDPTGTLTPTFSGTDASDFVVDSTDCTSLASLATCSVVVRFAATARGLRTAELVITDGTSSITAHSSLTASGYTVLIATPPTFSNTAVSATTSKTFTIVNASDHDTGAVTLSVTGGSDYAITGSTGCSTGIVAHTSCTVDVDFTPSATGTRTATLQASASPGGSHSVTLTGSGI